MYGNAAVAGTGRVVYCGVNFRAVLSGNCRESVSGGVWRLREALVGCATGRFWFATQADVSSGCACAVAGCFAGRLRCLYLAGLPDLLSLDSPHLVPLDVRREAFKRTVLHLLSRLREVILI